MLSPRWRYRLTGRWTPWPWLDDDDLVLGYESGDDAYAYPVNILNFHEIVNDTIGCVPVLITYCPFCFSGVVFNRELEVRLSHLATPAPCISLTW